MSLIRAAENIIGSIENWPSTVLEYLFCEIPNLHALEDLIAFFYGNGIPCPMASQLHHACNTKTASVTEDIYKTFLLGFVYLRSTPGQILQYAPQKVCVHKRFM